MANSYNYHFGGQAGIFISSIGGLAHGLIYLDEFFIVMSSVMLLVSSPIWFKIKKSSSTTIESCYIWAVGNLIDL